jgi:hypothetical protein
MSGGPGAKDAPHTLSEDERAREQALFGLGEEERREVLAWVGENLPYVRRTALGERPVYWILGTGLALGLAAYVGRMSVDSCSSRRRRRSHLDWLPICSIPSVGHCGPASSWSCSSRSSPRPSAVNSSWRSKPMRQLSARKQEPEARKHRPIESVGFRRTNHRGPSARPHRR